MEFTEAELEKRVKKIGKVEIKEEERMFLALGKNFRIENRKWKKEKILMDVEDIIYSERKEEEDRNNEIEVWGGRKKENSIFGCGNKKR